MTYLHMIRLLNNILQRFRFVSFTDKIFISFLLLVERIIFLASAGVLALTTSVLEVN